MISRIDAHHHFWKFKPEEYGWIRADMAALRKDYLPADLEREMKAAGINGTMPVQARMSLEETGWLLELAERHDFIKGVVGWAPLTEAGIGATLEGLAANRKLRAVRHVLHDEADEYYMLREDFNRGISELKRFNLAYDILIFERHLPQTLQFVDRHPNQVFVVDHLAKPRVRDGSMSPWLENMRELARRAHVYCKVSGLATEADHALWTKEQLEPYIEAVLSAFGAERVLFGTDWPVCNLAIGYGAWVEIVTGAISRLSEREQERIWSATAREAYKLND